ncbi:hypothetical protein N0V83_009822 [Neocucurbitaria cava]|uniref:U3 snoRNA associated-domain-containing protein n=1 Tax=Neocucurbitaria cava TaxID=798079 RepID=A0A9W8Y004_9PLEO|nr:hypothetical protein N0V83_009822 [Neocucurbitaria cava]
MFARVFDTAKRILSRSPSAQGRSSELRDTQSTSDAGTPDADVAMVTTRGGTETPGAATPLSSVKKRAGKRELESLDTPTQAKRQRKSVSTPKKKAVEEESEPDLHAEETVEELADTIAVTVPLHEAATKEDHLPIRRRTSPRVVVGRTSPPTPTVAGSVEEADQHVPTSTQETDFHTPEQQSGSVYATPATHMRTKASPTPKAKKTKHPKPASAKKSSARKQKAQEEDEPNTLEVTQTTSRFLDEVPSSTYDSDQALLSSQDAPAPSLQPKKEHVRFRSEEPADAQDVIAIKKQGHKSSEKPQDAAAAEPDEDDDDASDSDEAPEMMTTAIATTKAKAAQAEADRALRAQQLEEQAKRRQREARIAEEQAQKRIREEKKARKLAKQQAPETDDEALGPHQDILKDMKNLPALLPDSLLETIDDQRPPTPPPQRRGKTEEELRREKLSHHIKFLERSEKPAKDVKKGKLSVAVLRQQNRVLPPKANRDTRTVRELWLKGRKVEKKKGGKSNLNRKMERKAHGSKGFLRGGDD